MISVKLNTLWSDETEKTIKGVNEATDDIKKYILKLHNRANSLVLFSDVHEDIIEVCSFWTGKTYVGVQKDKDIEAAFQNFFEALMSMLLLIMNDTVKPLDCEKRFANAVLYRGTVYRYLGNDTPSNRIIKPQYNNIYVSWSKKPENTYLESKLYGVKTRLYCDIKEPYFGIDLEQLGISKGNEKEVVFPTLEEFITNIEYISEDNDDEA